MQRCRREARDVAGRTPSRSGCHPPDLRNRRIPLQGAYAPAGLRAAQGPAAGRTAQDAGLGQGDRPEDRRPVRGSRRRRQGRHDQALHGTSQSARRHASSPCRSRPSASARSGIFQRYIEHLPGGGRDRLLRPFLVQPRRRRAGDGLLHPQRISRVHARVPGDRAHDGALGHLAVQVLVLGHPGRAAAALSRRARTSR